MVNKLRLIFLAMVLIPQGVMFGMARDSLLAANKYFSDIEAVSLASALILVLGMPSVTVQWMVGKPLDNIRQLCSRVKQGNYRELLSLPNESRDGDDSIVTLMRDMNWMARQIEIRETDLIMLIRLFTTLSTVDEIVYEEQAECLRDIVNSHVQRGMEELDIELCATYYISRKGQECLRGLNDVLVGKGVQVSFKSKFDSMHWLQNSVM